MRRGETWASEDLTEGREGQEETSPQMQTLLLLLASPVFASPRSTSADDGKNQPNQIPWKPGRPPLLGEELRRVLPEGGQNDQVYSQLNSKANETDCAECAIGAVLFHTHQSFWFGLSAATTAKRRGGVNGFNRHGAHG
jgi:hypothetical protein